MDSKKTAAANIGTSKFSDIFFKALNSADLINTFNNPGPITVFLPPDSAFKKLPAAKLDSLLRPENKYDLIALLTYHALPGNISSRAIAKQINKQKGLAVFRTISGAALKAKFDEQGNIILLDEGGNKSTLLKNDIKQDNGVVHFISAVLMPRFKEF